MSVPSFCDRGEGPVRKAEAERSEGQLEVVSLNPLLFGGAGYGKMCYALFLQSRDEPSII